MKKLRLLPFFLIPIFLQGAVPTPEGLFKNGHNRSITGNLIIINLMIEEVPNQTETMYYKCFIKVEKNDVQSFLQVTYNMASMKKNERIQTHYFKNFQQSLQEDTSIERKLFYSFLMMMTANSSSLLSNLLKSLGEDYKTNEELLNQSKIRLYTKYRDYLKEKRESSSKELVSPLEPVRDDRKARIRETLNARTYSRSPHVALVKREESFFWKVSLKNVVFFFTNEEHRFSELLFNDPVGLITIQAKSYFLPDGIHELPKYIRFSSLNGKHYKIRILSLKHLNSKKTMASRKKFFQMKKSEEKLSAFPFIF